jgi:hypothetical protein
MLITQTAKTIVRVNRRYAIASAMNCQSFRVKRRCRDRRKRRLPNNLSRVSRQKLERNAALRGVPMASLREEFV